MGLKSVGIVLGVALVLLCTNCSKDNTENQNVDGEEDLLQTIENRFPFLPNQNFEAIYLAGRRNSNLEWYFHFHTDGSLDVRFTTDTNLNLSFPGRYTYANNEITILMEAGDDMPFPAGLNESTTVIMPQFGLVAAFATEQMVAVCIGHGRNTQQPPRVNANYGCPLINVQSETSEDNAIELVHSAVPFSFPVAGSVFRQQDRIVNRSENPIITRGYGIYRQSGNDFYATFRIAEDFADFARGQLPFPVGTVNAPFNDFNVLSGRMEANGTELFIDQLQPEAGPCQLR